VDLPPRVAAWAGWVAVASTVSRAAATTAAAVGTGSRRSVAASGGATVTTSVSALRSTTPASTAEATGTTSHATDVASSSIATATASATTATAATEARALTSDALEESGNFLVGLLEQVEEIPNDTTVATVEESSCDTSVPGTTSTTDTMDIVVNVSRQIVVDDVGDVRNIQSTIV
jgi:hypothetical protein